MKPKPDYINRDNYTMQDAYAGVQPDQILDLDFDLLDDDGKRNWYEAYEKRAYYDLYRFDDNG